MFLPLGYLLALGDSIPRQTLVRNILFQFCIDSGLFLDPNCRYAEEIDINRLDPDDVVIALTH